ncbi:zona pellucida sperm-binding protein 4-like [Spea bombifrons]|uniref:zona pellucida sperm-binding protein 4-like n=1 Tax=Spea bombifrons TaxID=233779 RepID=UPI00234AA369|nr:zona pellucida sperm-binding protein 4-like [Spea bombifrons]
MVWAGSLNGDTPEEVGLLCAEDGMLYTILKSQMGDAVPKLTVLDKKGKVEILHEDAVCGSNLTEKADGSIVIAATYDGCFVSHRNDSYVMVLMVSYKDDYGEWKVPEQKELSCPIRPAMDAPSPSQCTSVIPSDRILCGKEPVNGDLCQSLGCCYDASDRINTCYYGNKVTVQCTSDGIFSVAISKYVTLPPLNLESVTLARASDRSCTPVTINNAFLLFQFPLSACGTTFKSVGNQVVYENELVSKRGVLTWQGSSITRDSTLRLTVRCTLSSDSFLPLNVVVSPLTPHVGLTSYGPLNLEMRLAKDNKYSQYYTDGEYPVVKLLRDPVYVEVRILQRVDPQLVLVLMDCWATPTPDPYQQTQWPLLLERCPFGGDNYETLDVEVEYLANRDFASHYKRFIVRTFTFEDTTSQQPLHGQVHLHCSASVCVPSPTERCLAYCPTRRKYNVVALDLGVAEWVEQHKKMFSWNIDFQLV